ncbi:MAG: ADP-ribose diphosphatase [Alphaproteobacteria bacterium]
MTRDDVEIIEKTPAFEGYFRIDRYRLRHRLHEGGWSGEMTREVFERGHAAAMLPYDPALDRVVLIEQFRIGAFAAGVDPWLVEVVAGIIEPGETAEEVVRREALEETGCPVQKLVPICEFLVSPGGTSESIALFCGRVDAAGAGGIHGQAEEHEDIRVMALPFAKAKELVETGRIDNATALISLQWLILNRERLRREWR